MCKKGGSDFASAGLVNLHSDLSFTVTESPFLFPLKGDNVNFKRLCSSSSLY